MYPCSIGHTIPAFTTKAHQMEVLDLTVMCVTTNQNAPRCLQEQHLVMKARGGPLRWLQTPVRNDRQCILEPWLVAQVELQADFLPLLGLGAHGPGADCAGAGGGNDGRERGRDLVHAGMQLLKRVVASDQPALGDLHKNR